MRLADGLLMGRKIRGGTRLRGFRLKESFSQVPGSSHTYLPMFGRGRGLSELPFGVLMLVEILSVCPEGCVTMRSLEMNKTAAPRTWGRSHGKRKINHQWGRCNKPTFLHWKL